MFAPVMALKTRSSHLGSPPLAQHCLRAMLVASDAILLELRLGLLDAFSSIEMPSHFCAWRITEVSAVFKVGVRKSSQSERKAFPCVKLHIAVFAKQRVGKLVPSVNYIGTRNNQYGLHISFKIIDG